MAIAAVDKPRPSRALLSKMDVAEQLNCSLDTVRRLVISGKLRHTVVGNQWRFRQEWVDDYIDRKTLR